MTVLLIEDDEFLRRMVSRQLHALNITTILEASDGRSALAVLKEHGSEVGLILCDLDMPNMDGMEFVRHLGTLGLPAAFAIISGGQRAVLNAVQSMCHGYGIQPIAALQKPLRLGHLAELLSLAGNIVDTEAHPASKLPEFTLDEILHAVRARQFEPAYQPKISLRDGRIVGAEALARWRHPEHGLVPPAAFIGPLERHGHIDDLTFLMLDKAAADCSRWRSEGRNYSVSVNLSLSSLADTGLASRICGAVHDAGLDIQHMTLEVTETAAMTEVAPALENLARLRLRGFGLSIDDFGTGFASMEQLGRVAFTELKIDRSFVAAMNERMEARTIVESSIHIAHRLGMVSVAEGIETAEQLDALTEAGCDVAQGYYISKPLTGEEFRALNPEGPL